MSGSTPEFRVRDLQACDIAVAAVMHEEILTDEFLARCGRVFLRSYYRAWLASPWRIAKAAVRADGSLAGLLLGSWEPSRHYRSMLRTGGASIAMSLVVRSVARPRFGAELARTRGKRYARGLFRAARRALADRSALAARSALADRRARADSRAEPVRGVVGGDGRAPRTAEITHVMVDPLLQGGGVGRMLIDSAVSESRTRRVERLELVTPPEAAARAFYHRLGWQEDGEVVSSSGERFVRFQLDLEV